MNSVTFALDLKSEEEVIRFFRVNKTQISCIDEPNTFLNQIRDHGLVEEELYQKVTRMRKERRQDGVYQILNLIEKQGSHSVKKFWRCVFQDHILNRYPVLRTLQTSLLDGTGWVQENLLNAEILTGIENCETGLHTKGTKRKNITDDPEEGGEGSSALSQKKPATFSKSTDSHHGSRSTPCFNDPLDQVKDDACYICNEEEGVLVHCKQCPRAFHCECHIPVVQDQTTQNNWVCTFCVVKTNQQAQIPLKREDVFDCPVSGKLMHCHYLLLCMYKGDGLNVFTDNPSTTDAEQNSETSKTMWLNKVKTKLQNKKYTTVREFVNDIRLIFSNCQALNSDNEFGIMGAKLKEMFEREFQTIFKIK